MKRLLAVLVAALMLLSNAAFAAEDHMADAFVVGSATQMSGNFFTSMWGNNTSDIDVRTMIHGYRTVAMTDQAEYAFDQNVVSEWAISVDEQGNKTYVVDLQKDLTYSDGTPIGAVDYVFSILLQGSTAIAELGGAISAPGAIVGYDAYAAGKSEVLAGVRLLDTHRFSITINADSLPYFYELKLLDWTPYPISVIAPGCTILDDGEGAHIGGEFTKELLEDTIFNAETGYLSHPAVTSGPYVLANYDAQRHEARFEINSRYKGDSNGQKPSIPVIVFREVKVAEMIKALEGGEVHLINKMTDGQAIDDGLALLTQSTVRATNYLRNGFGFISFTCEEGPTQFQAVRQAVSYCLDKEAFTQSFTRDYGQTVYGYMGFGQWMVHSVTGLSSIDQDENTAGDGNTLSLDSLNPYNPDLEKAKMLLEGDGWTLNAKGDPYVEGEDPVRYKMVDDALMALTLDWAKLPNSTAADLLEEMLSENLASVGIGLAVIEVPFAGMLRHYYRQTDRTYDMFYLATNFDEVFDPYLNFNTADEHQGTRNTTGLRDEALMGLAKDMRETEPGNQLAYCTKWLAFQQRWNELLPMIPLYSNVYFDFYTPSLTGYMPDIYQSWASAILYASVREGDSEMIIP